MTFLASPRKPCVDGPRERGFTGGPRWRNDLRHRLRPGNLEMIRALELPDVTTASVARGLALAKGEIESESLAQRVPFAYVDDAGARQPRGSECRKADGG